VLSGHRRQAEELQRFGWHEIDLTRREYFVEAYRRGPAVTVLPSSPLAGVSRRTAREAPLARLSGETAGS
jgi:hypothetical protein